MAGPAGIVMATVLLAGCSGSGTASSNGVAATSVDGAAASVATGGGGGATGGPVTAGGDLCKLLGPGDFAAVGVTDASGHAGDQLTQLAALVLQRAAGLGN